MAPFALYLRTIKRLGIQAIFPHSSLRLCLPSPVMTLRNSYLLLNFECLGSFTRYPSQERSRPCRDRSAHNLPLFSIPIPTGQRSLICPTSIFSVAVRVRPCEEQSRLHCIKVFAGLRERKKKMKCSSMFTE